MAIPNTEHVPQCIRIDKVEPIAAPDVDGLIAEELRNRRFLATEAAPRRSAMFVGDGAPAGCGIHIAPMGISAYWRISMSSPKEGRPLSSASARAAGQSAVPQSVDNQRKGGR